MKTSKFRFIAVLFLTSLVAFSCKNKDPEPETLKLEGEWNLVEINFLSDELNWNPAVPFNAGTSVKYGPYMFSEVMGYNFSTTEVDNGFKADVIQSFYQAGEQVLWYWNYKDEQKSFEMTQVNLQFPPYDFGIKDVNNVKITDKGNQITFGAQIASRKSGGGFNDVSYYNAELILKKGTATENTIVKIQGENFVIPGN